MFAADDNGGFSHRLLNRDHLKRAHEFFEKYGGKAVILGRFVPIVRTFVPFVAGAAQMTARHLRPLQHGRRRSLWVGLCLGAGLLFGNVPIVKDNFSLVTIGIVAVSLLPMLVRVRSTAAAARSRAAGRSQEFLVRRYRGVRRPCTFAYASR